MHEKNLVECSILGLPQPSKLRQNYCTLDVVNPPSTGKTLLTAILETNDARARGSEKLARIENAEAGVVIQTPGLNKKSVLYLGYCNGLSASLAPAAATTFETRPPFVLRNL